MNTKQILVMRKFKSLRTGKYCAQAAHASLGAFFLLQKRKDQKSVVIRNNWLITSFRKITLYVETEEELADLAAKCTEFDIPFVVITDNGTTEFGEPTVTALGIGPWLDEELDKITGNLKLF